MLIVVLDEQDTPPVFTLAPPTTVLSPSLTPGDLILQVKAEDGDRGKPREIRYGLVSDGSPFYSFFDIDEQTGEFYLLFGRKKSMNEKTWVNFIILVLLNKIP